MFLKLIDLTSALRPAYLPDEVLLLVQDNVGLYEGKFKLPNQQNGQVYLTSHRICYVDKQEPRKHSVGLDLKDVERHEFYAGFLKSSAKVTLIPRQAKRSSFQSRAAANTSTGLSSPSRSHAGTPSQSSEAGYRTPPTSSAPQQTAATWVCTICSFPNPVPSNFDPATANVHTSLPPCLACGIRPALTHVLKAAIANVTSRQTPASGMTSLPPPPPSSISAVTQISIAETTDPASPPLGSAPSIRTSSDGVHCPRCTFLNHPSLLSCELCGAPLVSAQVQTSTSMHEPVRVDSPGPTLSVGSIAGLENPESVKLSFRAGGEKVFYEKLKGSLTQRKWLLHAAPPPPGRRDEGRPSDGQARDGAVRMRSAGIAGLEQMGLDKRKNTEFTIGNAFEDIDALMASAKEVIALANSLGRQLNSDGSSPETAMLAESVSQLGLVTTKDIVGGGGGSASESLYISELSRNLAEFLTDDARGVLKKAGGIVSLVDLWAIFNRARGGVELVSPLEFEKAARLWEDLKLPVRLRTFKSGVMVVQSRDRTDETTIRALLSWLRDLHEFPPEKEVSWDWREFGRGVTALDAAERFGWSIGVAEEELEMAEERGVLCREEGIEGLKFWENFIDSEERRAERAKAESRKKKDRALTESDRVIKALNASGIL